MDGFARSAILLFFAFRAGDVVNAAAGIWFVPRYVSPGDIGAVLPLTSFATFLSLPVFAFAMTVMKETAHLAAEGERGRIKSLLAGVFVATGIMLAIVLAVAMAVTPRFLHAMRVNDTSAGVLAVSAAFLGCTAPVYSDALQSLKRFKALAAVEFGGSLFRFLTMLLAMPFKALAGYFAGQAALPAFRMAASAVALKGDLSVKAEPFWDGAAVRRIALSFAAILAYQVFPMAAALAEQSVLRTVLPPGDSAGYYIVSRFSDFLFFLTIPLMTVMFPYTASAARRGEPVRPYVFKCSLATLAAAALLSVVYAIWGGRLLALVPGGTAYAGYAKFMPYLVIIAALTSCQVFKTNADVSAGRYGFLLWLVPLHAIYPAVLYAAVSCGGAGIGNFLVFFGAASVLRFLFAFTPSRP